MAITGKQLGLVIVPVALSKPGGTRIKVKADLGKIFDEITAHGNAIAGLDPTAEHGVLNEGSHDVVDPVLVARH